MASRVGWLTRVKLVWPLVIWLVVVLGELGMPNPVKAQLRTGDPLLQGDVPSTGLHPDLAILAVDFGTDSLPTIVVKNIGQGLALYSQPGGASGFESKSPE